MYLMVNGHANRATTISLNITTTNTVSTLIYKEKYGTTS